MNSADSKPLSLHQHSELLIFIATYAGVLSDMAASCASRLRNSDEAATVHGMSYLAAHIGALADEASGGAYRGGILQWAGGPSFALSGGRESGATWSAGSSWRPPGA